MNIKLLNGAWLIIVSLLVNNTFGQLSLNDNNNVEITVTCDQFDEITPPMVSSNCEGEITFSFEDKLYSGGCLGTIERIWTIRDDCNNTTSFQQFIRFDDKTEPELSEYPEDISVSENDIPSVPEIVASDNCQQKLKLIFAEEINKDDNGNTISIIRKWSVKDKCGNSKSHTQTITLIDGNS